MFELAYDGENIISVCLGDLNLSFDKNTLKSGMNYTIEHLCQYDLELTPSAIKTMDYVNRKSKRRFWKI